MLPAVRPSLPSWCAPLTAAFEGSFFALCAVVAVSPASQVGLIDRAPVGEVGRQSSLATKAVVWLWMVRATVVLPSAPSPFCVRCGNPCLAGFSSPPASSLRRRAVAIPSSR